MRKRRRDLVRSNARRDLTAEEIKILELGGFDLEPGRLISMVRPTDTTIEPREPARPDASDRLLDEGDISLIRSMLKRTPSERLEWLQDFVEGVVALRDGRLEGQ